MMPTVWVATPVYGRFASLLLSFLDAFHAGFLRDRILPARAMDGRSASNRAGLGNHQPLRTGVVWKGLGFALNFWAFSQENL
jgi:hypothetical protein